MMAMEFNFVIPSNGDRPFSGMVSWVESTQRRDDGVWRIRGKDGVVREYKVTFDDFD